ncbi:MAG: [NiFe]-hydrogenase assembly chaperone HybE [Magnetospirillum sp. WYHS-4]
MTAMEERIAALVERFRAIGEANMKTLPIYNDRIEVEAVGFAPVAEGVLGALITPWFLNLMLLPAMPRPWEPGRIGAKRTVGLPGGDLAFTVAGDEVVGYYESYSIRSPMQGVNGNVAARFLAEAALAKALTPPKPEDSALPEAPACERSHGDVDSARRNFLRGRFGEEMDDR